MDKRGEIEVSPKVVASIATEAVQECYGVVAMAARTPKEALLSALRRPPATKGVNVYLEDDTIVVELHVIIEYGTRIATVADNVISAVRFRLEKALGTSALRVVVFVEGVRVDAAN